MPKQFFTGSDRAREIVTEFEMVDRSKPDAPPDKFTLSRPMDSAFLYALNSAAQFDPAGTDATNRRAFAGFLDFMGACLADQREYARFYEIMVAPSRGMDQVGLMEFIAWVIEEISGVPLDVSLGSSPGQSRTGRRSTGRARTTRSGSR
jgi:hypothetical protein